MTGPSRLLLSTVLLLLVSCGFNDAQKISFVRAITEAILNATTSSSTLTRAAFVDTASPEPTVTTAPAVSACPKTHLAQIRQSPSPAAVVREAAATPLFEPQFIPIAVLQARLRDDARRAAAARLRCEVASARETLRRSLGAREFVFHTHTVASRPTDSGAGGSVLFADPDPAERTEFIFDTIGGSA